MIASAARDIFALLQNRRVLEHKGWGSRVGVPGLTRLGRRVGKPGLSRLGRRLGVPGLPRLGRRVEVPGLTKHRVLR